jgi:hypothetical protein
MVGMKTKLGQNPSQQKSFVPGTPSNNKAPSAPANQAPATPTK